MFTDHSMLSYLISSTSDVTGPRIHPMLPHGRARDRDRGPSVARSLVHLMPTVLVPSNPVERDKVPSYPLEVL